MAIHALHRGRSNTSGIYLDIVEWGSGIFPPRLPRSLPQSIIVFSGIKTSKLNEVISWLQPPFGCFTGPSRCVHCRRKECQKGNGG
jgi:hypothetical protein